MSDLHRQRRNLIIISVSIIVFVLAGGEIQKGSILGGTFTVENKNILLWFGIFAFVYSVWRYWLYLDDFMGNLKRDFKKAHFKCAYYSNLVEEHHPNDKDKGKIPAPPLIKQEGDWYLNYRVTYQENGGQGDTQYEDIIQIESSAAYRALTCLVFAMIIKERHVSETVLPYLIALTAAILIIYKLVALI